uniref:Uncharacterized protein n=1 Tax=Nelumbo nucifera TaxID=4432 RepID=A0A822YER3_NELNU|nr:TPA_asm: hypothetical protein HUJ06_031459 [Nelumbo nucifera]
METKGNEGLVAAPLRCLSLAPFSSPPLLQRGGREKVRREPFAAAATATKGSSPLPLSTAVALRARCSTDEGLPPHTRSSSPLSFLSPSFSLSSPFPLAPFSSPPAVMKQVRERTGERETTKGRKREREEGSLCRCCTATKGSSPLPLGIVVALRARCSTDEGLPPRTRSSSPLPLGTAVALRARCNTGEGLPPCTRSSSPLPLSPSFSRPRSLSPASSQSPRSASIELGTLFPLFLRSEPPLLEIPAGFVAADHCSPLHPKWGMKMEMKVNSEVFGHYFSSMERERERKRVKKKSPAKVVVYRRGQWW